MRRCAGRGTWPTAPPEISHAVSVDVAVRARTRLLSTIFCGDDELSHPSPIAATLPSCPFHPSNPLPFCCCTAMTNPPSAAVRFIFFHTLPPYLHVSPTPRHTHTQWFRVSPRIHDSSKLNHTTSTHSTVSSPLSLPFFSFFFFYRAALSFLLFSLPSCVGKTPPPWYPLLHCVFSRSLRPHVFCYKIQQECRQRRTQNPATLVAKEKE